MKVTVNYSKQGLVKKQTLTAAEVAEIEQLATMCNGYEGLHMRINWGALRTRSGDETYDFLYYKDDALVGYLTSDGSGTEERELTGMVHPNCRRKGIFLALFSAAKEESMQRHVQKVVLVCEHSSHAGQAFVKAIGAQHDFSEYEMVLGTFQERPSFDDRLHVRQADAGDIEPLVCIMASDLSDIQDAEERAKRYVTRFLQEPKQQFYLATLGGPPLGCEEPVGSLRLDEMEHEIGIYGFVVRPEYRGRGYGRQLLEEVVRTVRAESQKGIMLDVDTDNANALGLYVSCGFQIKTTYDYYGLDVHRI